jgi:signal recognition particle subunit SRP54
MGDVVSLVEKAQESVDQKEAEEAAEKFLQATFTFEDFLAMMRQVRKMGSIKDLLAMVPGLGAQLGGGMDDIDDRSLTRVEAIITSMTPQERVHPDLFDGSRRQRVARGSGTSVQEVNELLKEFRQMRKMMKGVGGGGGLAGRMMGLGKGRAAKRKLMPKVKGTVGEMEAFRQFQQDRKRKKRERKKRRKRR